MRLPTDDPRYRDAYDKARKAKNDAESFVWKLVLVPVLLLVVAAVFGGVIWYVIGQKNAVDSGSAPSASPSAPVVPAAVPNDGSTYECGGNMRIALGGQTMVMTGPGPAIRASGNCQLTLTNMNVTAPVAIEAGGNARVTIVGGSLTGSDKAIVASANAEVSVSGTTVTGETEQSGMAEITGL